MSNKNRNIFLIFSVFLVLIVATGCAFASDSDTSADDSASDSVDSPTTADVSQAASDTSSSDESLSSSSQSSSADTSSATDTYSSSSSGHSSSTTTKDTSSVSTTSKDVSSTSTSNVSTTTKDTTSSSTSSQATQTVKDTDNSVKAQQITTEKTLKSDDDDGTFTELNTLIQDSDSITLDKNYVRGEDESIINIAKDVTINGNGYTIDVNQQYGALNITSSANVVISNVAIVNDYYNVSSMTNMNGSTIQVDGASLTLNNVTMSNNTMRYGTGCILVTSNGNVEIYDSTFTNNYGMYGSVIGTKNGTLTVNNTEFINNSGNNGAVYTNNNSDVVNINNSKFENNYASNYGGAIQVNRGLVNVYNTEFINNTADTRGGAIYQNGNIYMTIENCVFTDNKVIGTASNMGNIQGGAIYSSFGLNLKNNTMSGNYAYNGSDICIYGNGNVNPTYITIENVTVASGEVPTLTAYVTDDMGNAITGGYLIFTVNGEEYDNDDVIEGVATCPLDSALEDGTYTITAEYTKVNASTTVVNLQEGTLTVGYAGSTGSFTELAELIESTEGTLTLTQNYARGEDEEAITITKDINIDGHGYTIDVNQQYGAFNITSSANVVMSNLEIINDYYNVSSMYDMDGATIQVDGASLTLNNVTMSNNTMRYGSGCILVTSNGNVEIYDSSFTNNYGMYGSVIGVFGGTVTINNTEFINSSGNNGAIYVHESSDVVDINNSRFINNSATNYGGAIQIHRGSLLVNNTEFINNSAETKGGAIMIDSTESYIIENSVFINNTIPGERYTYQGGAICVYSNTVLTLRNNTMSGNTAYNGSAIYLDSGKITPVYITVENVTVEEGEPITITTYVTDDMGNPVTGGTITFTVNGESYSAYVDEGVASYNITTSIDEGNYEITASYNRVNDSVEVVNSPGTLEVTVSQAFNYAKLQALIDEAEAGTTITIPEDVRRASSEDKITINKDITIDGAGFTIDANSGQVFEINDGATVTIKNIVVYDINAIYGGFANVTASNLILDNVTIVNSSTTGYGYTYDDSLIYIDADSTLDMDNTIIANSTGAALNIVGSADIKNSEIYNITATEVSNGVILLGSGKVSISDSYIGNNTATYGAIYGQSQKEELTVDNTIFYNNIARTGYGGAIFNNAPATITNSVFIGNSVNNNGGAIYTKDDLTVTNSIFINNTATSQGSAIYNGYGTTTITNSIILPSGSTSVIYTDYDDSTTTTADYNWWGTNSDPTQYVSGTDVNKWIVMTTTIEPEQPDYQSTVTITTTFDKYTDSTGTLYDYTETIPDGLEVTYTTSSSMDVLTNDVTTVVDGKTTNTLEIFEDTTLEVTQAEQTNTFDIEVTMPEPEQYIVREENFYEFFNEDGTVNKNKVIPYSELQFAGTITDKVIILDQPLNLTSYSEDPVDFKNLRIDVVDGAQGSNITNLVIDNTDYSEYVIGIMDTSNITVEGNTLSMTNQDSLTRTIYVNGSIDTKIIGNTITTYGPSDDIDYYSSGGMTGFADTMSIMVYNSTNTYIDSNVLTTGYTTIKGNYHLDTIVGLGIYGNVLFDSSYHMTYVNSTYTTITNNVISGNGNNYTYGIDLSYGAYYSVVKNNTITSISNLYSAGVQVSGPGSYNNITENRIDLKANNITYGIILQSVYGSTSDNIVTYNTITTESSTTYLIELYNTNNNNVSYNDLKSENVNAAMGIGLSGSNNNYIEYNNIEVSGTNDKTPYPGDHIQAKNTGIGLYESSSSNTIRNNNVESTVGTGDCYAVDLNTTTSNTVTNNYLVSTGYEGDESVFSTSDTNTIENNEPDSTVTVDGRTVTVTVDVGEENDGYIIVKVNGKTLKDEDGKTIMAYVTDGVATYTFDLNASSVDKDYEVSYVYSGSAGVLRGSKNVTISPEIATVVVDAIDNAKAGQTVTLTAHITDSKGEAVTSGKVVFKLNGKTLKDANDNTIYGYVDENGDASINYTLPDNYSAKDYILTAVFQGSGYERAEANSTLTIVKTTPTILPDSSVFGSDNKITITHGTESVQIKATINDPETNTPIDSTTIVTIKINNKTVTQQYVNDGQIDITIYTSSFKNPEYTITVVVGENSLYARTTLDATLEVVTPTSLSTDTSYNGTLLVTPAGLETGSSYNGTIEAKD